MQGGRTRSTKKDIAAAYKDARIVPRQQSDTSTEEWKRGMMRATGIKGPGRCSLFGSPARSPGRVPSWWLTEWTAFEHLVFLGVELDAERLCEFERIGGA